MKRPVALLMVVPQGLTVTGVTTWALSLTAELAARGVRTGLIVHGCAPGFAEVDAPIGAGVRVYRPEGLPPIDEARGDIEPFARAYADAATDLGGADATVCLVPMRHGDCFGACARVTQILGDRVRLIGWQQNDSAYEDAILARYAPAFAGMVGVSAHIADRLRHRFPDHADAIARIWNAVRVPAECPARSPAIGRPIELVYTGRLEHEQKRIGALVALSDALSSGGLEHRLTLIGDGPALHALRHMTTNRSERLFVPGPGSPRAAAAAVRSADLFVLASRIEGLSFSMLEAMAQGCAIVATRTESGASEAVVHGASGVLVDVAPDADDSAVGRSLSAGVADAIRHGLPAMGRAAWARARDHFDLAAQADATERLMRRCADAPMRVWPPDRACAFSPRPGSSDDSGVVPADAAARLGAVLDALADRRIVIHGAGAHTHHLMPMIRDRIDRIVAFADDNPAAWGFRIEGRPVIAPAEAAALGATEVVLSSFIHERSLWERRAIYERQGLRVHRVYSANQPIESSAPVHRPVVVSVHGPDVTSGVTTWAGRMCDRSDSACAWRMVVAGERSAINEARSRWPGAARGTTHFVSWDDDASALDCINTVRTALADMGADAVVGNYVPEAYAAGALMGIATIGIAHAQHEWYREVLGRASRALGTWWAVSTGAHERALPGVEHVRFGGVIPCGVAIGALLPLDETPARTFRLLYAGRLENVEKRVMDLVVLADALCAQGVSFEMRIVGDGPAEAALRASAGDHIDAGRIHVVGPVPSEAMPDQFAWADAVVLVSNREGMPVVAMEAMAAGRPVAITGGCGDAVQLVRESGCGVVVPIGAMEELGAAIGAWARDRSALVAMGARGHAAARARCDIHATGNRADIAALEAIDLCRASTISARARWDAVLSLVELIGDATEAELRDLVRTIDRRGEDAGPLATALPGLWRMEERLMREALDRARSAGLSRLAIFPAGRHTRRLGRALADAGEVVVIIDDHAPPDADMHGRAIMTPEAALRAGIDGVIISSDQHESMLSARARSWGLPIATLYGDPETLTAPGRPAAA